MKKVDVKEMNLEAMSLITGGFEVPQNGNSGSNTWQCLLATLGATMLGYYMSQGSWFYAIGSGMIGASTGCF